MTRPIALSGAGDPGSDRPGCSDCRWRELCLPGRLPGEALHRAVPLGRDRRLVKAGEHLYRAGEPFAALYAVYSGQVKETIAGRTGQEQIVGFRMAGELVGLRGFAGERHHGSATALESGEVCVIPAALLERLLEEVPALRRRFHVLMSAEIARANGHMLLLGTARSEQCVAAFLLDLSGRHARRGHSLSALRLRMTRGEIGSYLGLTFETVTRAFRRFRANGLIAVAEREVSILDRGGLEALCAQGLAAGEA